MTGNSMTEDGIDRAINHWKNQLLDIGGNNRLLYYRDLKTGTLDLSPQLQEVDNLRLDQALSQGRRTRLSEIFQSKDNEATIPGAQRRAKAIHRKALENLEERGIDTLFVAMGMLTWKSTATASTPNAPLLLFPLALEPVGAGSDDFFISVDGEPELNPTLVQFLQAQHGVALDPEALLDAHTDSNGDIQFKDLAQAAHKEIRKEIGSAELTDRTIIGNFSYQKLPMIRDLEQNTELLRNHEMVMAVAGDKGAIERLRHNSTSETTPIDQPDSLKPRDEFLTLDCDSSQNHAINRALKGENLVVQGPPGTGKSQTIANLIGCFAAQGKSVLFVAEKRAAIEAVNKNLIKTGLDDLIMDLHGGSNLKKQLANNLAKAIEQIKTAAEPNTEILDQKLERSRNELRHYVSALHDREQYGASFFEASCERIDLEAAPTSSLRLKGKRLERLNRAKVEQLGAALSEFIGLGGLELVASQSEWLELDLENDQQTALAGRAFADLRASLQSVDEAIDEVCNEAGATAPNGFEQAQSLVATTSAINTATQQFSSEFLANDVATTARALKGKTSHGLRKLFSSKYRAAFNKAETAIADDGRSPLEIRRLVEEADRAVSEWSRFSNKAPQYVHFADEATTRIDRALEHANAASASIGGNELTKKPADSYLPYFRELLADEPFIPKLARLNAARSQLEESGFEPLLAEAAQRNLDQDQAAEMLEYCWFSSIIESTKIENPAIGAFEPLMHESHVSDFSMSDRQHLDVATDRIKRRVASAAIDARNTFPEQDAIVLKEAGKKTRHMPIRKLLAEAPDVIPALRPCWAMSPLLVAQLLPARPNLFDVVIFDEASQVEPADAISSIMRAKQVIVAGDTRQLPPTKFFASTADDADNDEDDSAALTVGFESILDVLAAALPRHAWLTWHYRSRDERLINFSNAYVYDGMMKTFPGPIGDGCLKAVRSEPGVPIGDNDPVIDKVVELCIEHALTTPERSLGVITLGVGKATKIDDAMHRALRGRDDLAEFFDESQAERFFVKNIERVQGDERDTIMLVADLKRNADGSVSNRLGPINMDGGERRLNVAITRARSAMTLVTTFGHNDLSSTKFKSKGAQLFRDYVRYAETAGEDLGEAARRTHPLNPFEADVASRLQAAGVPLIPQFGVAGYRIDFVALDPNDPSRKVLAIEADGASYHSLPTARDRDRLRQGVLENLGWSFHRIWSTAWFRDPDTEVRRAVDAWQQAVLRDPTATSSRPESSQATDRASGGEPERTKPRPHIVGGDPITVYSDQQLDDIVDWVKSDGVLRTDDELMRICQIEMGYGRLGSKIKQCLAAAISRTK